MLSKVAEDIGAIVRFMAALLCAIVITSLGASSAEAAISCGNDGDCNAVVAPCAKDSQCVNKICEFVFEDEGEKCSYGDINGNQGLDFCLEAGVCDSGGLCISFRDFCPGEGLDCVDGGDGSGECIEQKCGDGICSGDETRLNCSGDCESYRATCGDGICESAFGEDIEKCRVDCACGDGVCENELGEYDGTCPADCLPTCNVNGLCGLDEDSEFCGADCVCGDKICDLTEAADQSCPGDCEGCNGNTKCDQGETANTCRADCSCGDGVCDPFESGTGVCPADCGGCGEGNTCQIPFGDALCDKGMCVIDQCANDYGDCDSAYANGCEIDTANDEDNCGSCDNDCSAAPRVNAAICADSKCGIESCDTGYADCDGDAVSGCEANLRSVATCGNCNRDCRNLLNVAQSTCSSGGSCGIASCNSGFSNCDGIASNGCETTGACPRCGDGIVNVSGEECDEGDSSNGLTTCGCQSDCTFSGMMVTCNDDAFCTASDTCNGSGFCVGSGDTCDTGGTTPFCDEQNNECDECQSVSDCTNGLACDGTDTCASNGSCQTSTPPSCGTNEVCTEPSGGCDCAVGFVRQGTSGPCVPRECTVANQITACDDNNACTDDTCSGGLCESDGVAGRDCDNGLFCDGAGECDSGGACIEPGTECTGGTDVCDEANNRCVECKTSNDCDGGLLCETTSGVCVQCLSASDCPTPDNECETRVCGPSNLCSVARKGVGAACSSDGDACDGTESCQNIGTDFGCQSSGMDPCAADPANPLCQPTGSDLFECNSECGDGLVGFDEDCDLGTAGNSADNQVSGCSTSCTLNEGWRCAGGATSCSSEDLESICGDSIVIASSEVCDAGTGNGQTPCGCTAACDFRAAATPCSDGQFCTVNDECNGAGACVAGQGSPCALGDDACREATDACDECLLDSECNDSSPCNGQETCDSGPGTCSAGTSVVCAGELACNEQSGACACPGGEVEVSPGVCEPSACTSDGGCDDGDVCNGIETCNVSIEQCVSGQPLACSDGAACNGQEACNATTGCVAGTPKTCGTGSECVEPSGACMLLCGNGEVDSGEECDDGTVGNSDTDPDSCRTNCVFAFCGDLVVDGPEQCDDGNGTPGDGCSANCLTEACSDATVMADCTDLGVCQRPDCVDGACFYNDLPRGTTTGSCDTDGEFCNGDEICSGNGTCIATGDPCAINPQLTCSESLGSCVRCLTDEACTDGVFCNGQELCDASGSCQPGGVVECGLASICDEATSRCVSTCGNGICNAGETSSTCPADCDEGEGDSDGDGIPDVIEVQLGTLPGDKDSDGDGVPDDVEVGSVTNPLNTDGDSLINALDPDDDGDGIDTLDEDLDGDGDPTNDDSDGDGIPDYLDDDDDNDNVPSELEAFGTTTTSNRKAFADGLLNSDEDELPNYLDNDDDNDTILTADEIPANSSPWLNDSDSDGIPNYIDDDDDGDGLLTAIEIANFAADFDGDGVPNHLDVDDDDDDVLTASEVSVYESNPYKKDTDDDLLLDGDEVRLGTTLTDPDTDSDGLLDGDEVRVNADPLDSDTDDDGLLDGEEVNRYGTGVRNPDTDDDFLLDGLEIDPWGTDPLDEDTDDDTILDGIEVRNGTDPNDPNSGPDTGGDASGGCQSTRVTGLTWLAMLLGMVGLLGLSYRAKVRSRRSS